MISVLVTLKPKLSIVASIKPKLSITANLRNVTIGGSSDNDMVEFIAAQTIDPYNIVTVNGDIADSSNPAHRNRVLGIATSFTNAGFPCNAVVSGKMVNTLWAWNIGDILFLNGNNLSTVPPATGWVQEIAKAVKSDTIVIQLNEAILL